MTATTSGPTHGAELHSRDLARWQAKPRLARALRLMIMVLPLVVSFGFTSLAGRFVSAERLGLSFWTWTALVFVAAICVLAALRKVTERLLPLIALMKLTLVFPDQVPSRMKATLRESNSRKLLRNITDAKERGETSEETKCGDYLLQLLKEVNEHDRLTRGHSERVRGYAELLGQEIGLSDDDMHKLRWAALLHDVGKLEVPSEILNHDGLPTTEQWQILSRHPAAAIPLLEPLRPWLGDWVHAADQHHCRWDGHGYPTKLAGTEISLAGRMVAIADAYDVMTTRRSYKPPLSVEQARQELTACAGTQFDPALVRSFLQVGLGQLRTVAGPLAWLAGLTVLSQVPFSAVGRFLTKVQSSAAVTTGMVLATMAGAGPQPDAVPEALAFRVPTVTASDQVATATEGEPFTLTIDIESSDGAPAVTFRPARSGHTDLQGAPTLVQASDDPTTPAGGTWQTVAIYTPDDSYFGEDMIGYEACVEQICSTGTIAIEVLSSNQSPRPLPDSTDVVAGDIVEIDLLANDVDPDDDHLSIESVDTTQAGTVRMLDRSVEYTAPLDFTGSDTFRYTVIDPEGVTATAVVTVNVRPVIVPPPPRPSLFDDADTGFATSEDTSFTTADVTANDALGFMADEGPWQKLGRIELVQRPVHGSIDNNGDGTFFYTPNPDFFGTDSFSYFISTVEGVRSDPAIVTLSVTPVDDPPVLRHDEGPGFATDEDVPFVTTPVTRNDSDVDGTLAGHLMHVVSPPRYGTISTNNDGSFNYSPVPDFNGDDTFVYCLVDSTGQPSDPAEVVITVRSVNDAPVANSDVLMTWVDTPFFISTLTDNDFDIDTGLAMHTISVVDTTEFGTLAMLGPELPGVLAFTPLPGFVGTAYFTYTIADVDGMVSAPATVAILVLPLTGVEIVYADDYNDHGAAWSVVTQSQSAGS